MMKIFNAVVKKADMRFYPEVMQNQIELVLQFERGNAFFRSPATSDRMLGMYRMFNTGSIGEMNGKYCRVAIDENTGVVDSIGDILYENENRLENDPIV